MSSCEKLVEELNSVLPEMNFTQRVNYLFREHGDLLAMTTAFGYSGMILLNAIRQISPTIPIYFIDTRFHFPETLSLAEQVQREWGLEIKTLGTDMSEGAIASLIGENAYKVDPDACCHVRKVIPLETVLPGRRVWLHALRRDQSPSRANLGFAQLVAPGLVKVYPIADWTREHCWEYIRREKILYNPLHDEGYPSIGCIHCTARVSVDGHEREGRWNSFPGKFECGLHTFLDDEDR